MSIALSKRPQFIRCLVSFYAFLDAPPGMSQYSPLAQLRLRAGGMPPMFIARMGNDDPNIRQSVEAFIQQAKVQAAPLQVVDYPDGVHAFDINQNTDQSREVIRQAIAFVKKHLE